MSVGGVTSSEQAMTRLMAGELAKSLWETAKPQDVAGADDAGGQVGGSSGADTFGSLFTDVLADAIAGTPKVNDRSATHAVTDPSSTRYGRAR